MDDNERLTDKYNDLLGDTAGTDLGKFVGDLDALYNRNAVPQELHIAPAWTQMASNTLVEAEIFSEPSSSGGGLMPEQRSAGGRLGWLRNLASLPAVAVVLVVGAFALIFFWGRGEVHVPSQPLDVSPKIHAAPVVVATPTMAPAGSLEYYTQLALNRAAGISVNASSPQVLVARRIAASQLTCLGLAPSHWNIYFKYSELTGDTPIVVILLKGDFKGSDTPLLGMRLTSAASYRYLAYFFRADLNKADPMTSEMWSPNGGAFSTLLGDPTLSDDPLDGQTGIDFTKRIVTEQHNDVVQQVLEGKLGKKVDLSQSEGGWTVKVGASMRIRMRLYLPILYPGRRVTLCWRILRLKTRKANRFTASIHQVESVIKADQRKQPCSVRTGNWTEHQTLCNNSPSLQVIIKCGSQYHHPSESYTNSDAYSVRPATNEHSRWGSKKPQATATPVPFQVYPGSPIPVPTDEVVGPFVFDLTVPVAFATPRPAPPQPPPTKILPVQAPNPVPSTQPKLPVP